jgi:hypothetical protein
VIQSLYLGAANGDGTAVIESDGVLIGSIFEFGSIEGAMNVFIKFHESDNWRGPISFADRSATDPAPVVVTAAGGYYAFRGSPHKIKLQQSGGTAVTGAFLRISSGN